MLALRPDEETIDQYPSLARKTARSKSDAGMTTGRWMIAGERTNGIPEAETGRMNLPGGNDKCSGVPNAGGAGLQIADEMIEDVLGGDRQYSHVFG